MPSRTLITILCALSLQGCITDTLADMGIEVDPALQATPQVQGIDPGIRHARPGEVFAVELVPQFLRARGAMR